MLHFIWEIPDYMWAAWLYNQVLQMCLAELLEAVRELWYIGYKFLRIQRWINAVYIPLHVYL